MVRPRRVDNGDDDQANAKDLQYKGASAKYVTRDTGWVGFVETVIVTEKLKHWSPRTRDTRSEKQHIENDQMIEEYIGGQKSSIVPHCVCFSLQMSIYLSLIHI